MRLRSKHNVNRRRIEQAIGFNIPTHAPQHFPARRREAGEVRHRRAGDKPNRTAARQTQRLQQPAPSDFLARGRGRRRLRIGDVLAPSAGQPIGGNARGRGRSNHPTEKARPHHVGQTAVDQIEKLSDDGSRGQALRRHWLIETRQHLGVVAFWPMWPGRGVGAKVGRPLRHLREQGAQVFVVHGDVPSRFLGLRTTT